MKRESWDLTYWSIQGHLSTSSCNRRTWFCTGYTSFQVAILNVLKVGLYIKVTLFIDYLCFLSVDFVNSNTKQSGRSGLMKKDMANTFCLVRTALFTVFSAICFINPSTAHAQFTSSFSQVGSSPSGALGNKTPLILIHGIHGRSDAYWQNFVTFFNGQGDLSNKYKLYKFKYDNDEISIHGIGAYLADAINDRAEFASKK
jgi:hypothetical protein